MHSVDVDFDEDFTTDQLPTNRDPCFQFAPCQKDSCLEDRRIGQLVAKKTEKREFFYGLEILAQNRGTSVCLDFNKFLPTLPLFMSVVWTKKDSYVTPLEQVKPLQLISLLEPHIPAMPHVTLFRMSEQRLDELFAMNITNWLTLRGDHVDKEQPFIYGHEMVQYARHSRGSDISICVAGYPEGYTNMDCENQDRIQNIRFLKQKIDAGADFVITQLCYYPEIIVEFLQDARNAGIQVPILIGIMVPDSFKTYEILAKITNVRLPPEDFAVLMTFRHNNARVSQFFIELAIRTIQRVQAANLGVYGVHLYTLNRYEPYYELLSELRSLGILKSSSSDIIVTNIY